VNILGSVKACIVLAWIKRSIQRKKPNGDWPLGFVFMLFVQSRLN
jgi:hypothetical protein